MPSFRVLFLLPAIGVLAACAGDGPPPPAATPSATTTQSPSSTASATRTETPGPTTTGTRPPTFTVTVSPTPSSSPSPSPTETPSGPTLAAVQARVFNPNCLGSGCHNATDRSARLVLEEGHAFGSLVGVEPSNPSASRAGLLRVDPGRPENSFIVVKLEGPSRSMGSRMPLGMPPLSEADIRLVRDWILGGAAP